MRYKSRTKYVDAVFYDCKNVDEVSELVSRHGGYLTTYSKTSPRDELVFIINGTPAIIFPNDYVFFNEKGMLESDPIFYFEAEWELVKGGE